ncbi:MAG: spore germination protein [Candidatus Petromonas sp.]|nr:spore germination protein [Candidatus Petromonas sp.]
MFKKQKISHYQFKILVVMCFVGTSILVTPGGLAAETKQDAWLAAIIGLLLSFPIVWIYNFLGNHLYNMTLIEYTEKVLGKWLGKLVSLSFIFFCFINSASLLYIVGDFVTTQIMPETPIQFTNTLFVIVVVMGSRLGIETLARAGEILYPWVIGIFIILIFLLFPNTDIKKIQPIFEHGIKTNLRGALLFMSYSSLTLIVLLMIFPAYINKPQKAKKTFLRGTLIGGLMIFIMTLFSILVLGHDFTARNVFPSYILVKKISLADFLERMEAAIATLWIITIFYKIVIYFYGAILGLAQTLNLQDYRPLTLPMAMILIVISLIIYPNVVYANTWNSTTWIPFVLTFGLFLPLLLLIVAVLRK